MVQAMESRTAAELEPVDAGDHWLAEIFDQIKYDCPRCRVPPADDAHGVSQFADVAPAMNAFSPTRWRIANRIEGSFLCP